MNDEFSNRVRPLALASIPVAVSSLLGLCEWLVRSGASDMAQLVAVRTLLGVIVFYGALGLLVFPASLRWGESRKPIPEGPPQLLRAVAVAPAVLLFLAAVAAAGKRPLLLLACAVLAWVTYRGLIRVVARLPVLERPSFWWAVHGIVLLACLGIASRRPPDLIALWMAAGAILLAMAGLLAGLRAAASPGRPGSAGAFAANALLVVACLVLAIRIPADAPDVEPTPRSAVLLVTIDTLRADHVGAYGYRAARTPNFDSLAMHGVLFREAVTQSPWTGPSHTSILTGLLPSSHGVRINGVPLRAGHKTLMDALRDRGYVTGAFIGGWVLEGHMSGLGSRFHTYDDDVRDFTLFPWHAYRITLFHYLRRTLNWFGMDLSSPARNASKVTDSALAWLERNAGRPCFTWVHYYDPHLPYAPPASFLSDEARAYSGPAKGLWYPLGPSEQARIVSDPANVEYMISLYDAEIAFVDRELGRLLETARRAAPDGRLLIVVTSDHGESMGEHGVFFGRELYEPTSLVPLVIVPPEGDGYTPVEIESQVRLVDLAPTILELVGAESTSAVDGSSLVDLMRARNSASPGPAFTMMFLDESESFQVGYAVRHFGWKLIHRIPGWRGRVWSPAVEEAYDLRNDPGEVRNLVVEAPQMRSRLKALLKPLLDGSGPLRLDLQPEEVERLRGLGYVQ